MTHELLTVAAVLATLVVAVAIALITIARENKRQKLLRERVALIIGEIVSPIGKNDGAILLTKSVGNLEQLIVRAAAAIDVDLNQTETYPIKWWLIPFISIALSWLVVEIASHPLGHHALLMLVGWPVCSFFVTKFVFNWMNNKRNGKLLEQFPDALNSIVRSVRVGIPMAEALRTVSRDALEPTKAEFLILADKVAIGIPLDVALRELAIRIKLTEYQFFATALTLQARSGGGITQTLETLADVIRKRMGLKARGYALTAEARTSALILAALPFVAGGGIFLMQRPYAELLFTTKGGQSCLGAAILLMIAGMGTIQYMINNVLK
jgi:tight adherence protein B